MSVELHLPDLPEVPLSLGPPAFRTTPRVAMAWHLRLRQTLAAYLPLLLMLLLSLVSWWLVKNSPQPLVTEAPQAPGKDPDYTMERFTMERFDAQGRLKLRIQGRELRHYPASDRLEIDDAVIRAVAPDGRVTLAQARQAVGTGYGSELQLRGGAEVVSERPGDATLVMRSDFLHAFLLAERVSSDREVLVQLGASQIKARNGLDYDHTTGRLALRGPLRTVIAPGQRP